MTIRTISLKAGRRALAVLAVTAATGLFAAYSSAFSAEPVFSIPAPAVDEQAAGGTETAVFAGGCFWGVQGVFQHVKGVKAAISGYAGGQQSTAAYESVSTGATGHAESVEVVYDPSKVTYGKLLQVYFSVAHNPTQLNYQGPDHGTQYRSTVFVQDTQQKKIAQGYIAQLDKANVYPRQIVTTVESGKPFFKAEDYHQNFLTLNPTYPYIAYNDLPKITALKKMFPEIYRAKPVLVNVPQS